LIAVAQYRIVHFATHGALAGEIRGSGEPGLILTPPQTASAEDDGYLTASEIAGLKLDADWVILSACNTAAGHLGRRQTADTVRKIAVRKYKYLIYYSTDDNAEEIIILTIQHGAREREFTDN
jgi:CHAT domain-containing protein